MTLPVPATDDPHQPQVSIIVPTYREAENLPHLIDRVARLRSQGAIDCELIVVDDDSQDGTETLMAQRPEPWVGLIVRKEARGLSQAVLAGLRAARGEHLVVMDADLSHPPEAIPQLLESLRRGADFALGSRYVSGGTTAHDWGFLRWINSRIATLLAWPLTTVTDPMSGFFALSRATLERAEELSPVGYKIALELIVKCRCQLVREIPIHFSNRLHGESKLTLRQQLLYLRHLRRLYIFRYGTWSHLTQFLTVGALGTLVNLTGLTLLVHWGTPERPALLAGIGVSLCFNFALNRRFTFSYARAQSIVGQFFGFVLASAAGAATSYLTAIGIRDLWPATPIQLAAVAGIGIGSLLNFVANRFVVFRQKHVRPPEELPAPAADDHGGST